MATPKFIVDMKSQPRSMEHGNRRTAKASYGDPVDRTRPRDDRAVAYPAYNFARSISPPIFAFDPRVVADNIKRMADMVSRIRQEIHEITAIKPLIPHHGITAGEIIGYRLWWVSTEGTLRSLTQPIHWVPGKPMTGDVEERVNLHSWKPRFGGVYAFKTFDRTVEEFEGVCKDLHNYDRHSCGLALGSVKLWGEVVEHEHGYRASFAKPHSLDTIHYWAEPEQDPREIYFGKAPK
jgi:hypothetical protein